MIRSLLVLILLAFCGVLEAQNGSLHGVITDESGALVPGAKVTASEAGGPTRETTSGNDGSYAIVGLPAGRYSVTAALPGLRQAEPAMVDVSAGAAALNIVMHVAAEKQEITVQENVGQQIATDPSQNADALVLHGDDLEELSDDPDDLQADLEALAGPAAGPNGGQIYIDGFTGGDAPLPNKDAIREVRINQNPFAPEFSSIGYGSVQILTKPGTDRFRGTAYFNYANDIFNSRNPYAAQKAPFDLKEYGGSFGGPINKKSSFFFDVDNRDIDNGAVINAITLNPTSLLATPYTQVYSSPLSRLRLSPRVDYQINAKNTLILRYTLTRNDTTDGGVGNFSLTSQAYNSLMNENDIEGTETAVISTKVINETHFQFRHQNYTQNPTTTQPSINVASAFNGGGSSNGIHDYIHHHYEFQNYTTVVTGAHTWKFGIRVRATQVYDTNESNYNGSYTFGGAYAPILNADNMPVVPGITCNPTAPAMMGCATISSIEQYRRTILFQQMGFSPAMIRQLGGGATQFSLNAGNPLIDVVGTDTGLFVGDDWRVRPNLTLSLGLRYETQTNISDHGDFAPRVAFAYAPGGNASALHPKFVIRGGFGIFYDRFQEQSKLLAERFNGTTQQQYVITNPDTFPAVPPVASLQNYATTQSIYTIDPHLRAPYVLQSALGVERQFTKNTTIAVKYINTHGLHQLLTRDINAPLPGTYTGVPGTGVFPYGNSGPIDQMESAGLYNQNQLITSVNSRIYPTVSLWGYYTLAYAKDNTEGVGFFPANQYNLNADYGPASNDIRNRGVMGGSIGLRWGFRMNPFIIMQSGAPFNITTSQDVYGDTILDARPGIVTNPNLPGVISTRYGLLDPNPAPGEKILPRNYGRSPGQFTVNLRFSKTFAFGPERAGAANPNSAMTPPWFSGPPTNRRYNLTFALSVRNLLNHVNPGPIIGNINSPLFGESNQIAGGYGAFAGAANNRRLELQMRFSF